MQSDTITDMHIWLSLSWWYSAGIKWIWKKALYERLDSWYSYFSVPTLVRTLFSPFKQTYTGGGTIAGAVDRFISRFVGFGTRSFLLLAWVVASLAVVITGIVVLLIWPLLPVLIPVSIVLQLVGVRL
jgi:hypothetical protein